MFINVLFRQIKYLRYCTKSPTFKVYFYTLHTSFRPGHISSALVATCGEWPVRWTGQSQVISWFQFPFPCRHPCWELPHSSRGELGCRPGTQSCHLTLPLLSFSVGFPVPGFQVSLSLVLSVTVLGQKCGVHTSVS